MVIGIEVHDCLALLTNKSLPITIPNFALFSYLTSPSPHLSFTEYLEGKKRKRESKGEGEREGEGRGREREGEGEGGLGMGRERGGVGGLLMGCCEEGDKRISWRGEGEGEGEGGRKRRMKQTSIQNRYFLVQWFGGQRRAMKQRFSLWNIFCLFVC